MNSSNVFFALCLTKHYRWGYTVAPYLLKIIPEKDILRVHELVTGDNLKRHESLLTDIQVKMTNLIDRSFFYPKQ